MCSTFSRSNVRTLRAISRHEAGRRVYQMDIGWNLGFAAAVKNVRFVFDDQALPDLIVLCLGQIETGDRLFNTLPSQLDEEPAFIVEGIAGLTMTVRTADDRRRRIQFRCLTQAQWDDRFS